ncbi:hypothetical protein UFOVP965_95 [uncultured Caudovirales phage]|uniref:Uncharacterized protein n=1 Tax=uncultured Caudovirales phage TaxID=2100421 RepID=A0A6J5QW32_9CAUD|nr:hypothetical protein UFOVP965_95 [uncultured Caudovirales phage]CAB4179871.1 hypothetical protein UFOVP1035_91 [uncultured Caudovirales phage]CAB4188683.1 hypothetical protein UFOVP1181_50 [uncultured Caudovirales phage]
MKYLTLKKTAEDLRRLMGLRKSNASGAIKSKKTYSRKTKHRKQDYYDDER